MGVIYPKKITGSTSLGTYSVTVPAVTGICYQIIVKAATSTTTFDLRLTDIFSLRVLEVSNITGMFNSLLQLPCYGNWTLTVLNASTDETFTNLIVINEG